MESVTEVRYVGVVVGRGAALRGREPSGAFVVFPEPLPVGTQLVLRGDDGDQPALVTEVTESADANVAGMRVRFTGAVTRAKTGPHSVPAAAPPAKVDVPEAQARPESQARPEAQARPEVQAAPEVQPAAEVQAAAPEAAAPTATDGEASSGIEPGSGDHSHPADAGAGHDQGQGGSGKRRRRRR